MQPGMAGSKEDQQGQEEDYKGEEADQKTKNLQVREQWKKGEGQKVKQRQEEDQN